MTRRNPQARPIRLYGSEAKAYYDLMDWIRRFKARAPAGHNAEFYIADPKKGAKKGGQNYYPSRAGRRSVYHMKMSYRGVYEILSTDTIRGLYNVVKRQRWY